MTGSSRRPPWKGTKAKPKADQAVSKISNKTLEALINRIYKGRVAESQESVEFAMLALLPLRQTTWHLMLLGYWILPKHDIISCTYL